MTPPVITKLDWSSAIGLFIVNFGVLDYLVLDFLELRLPPERFAKVKELHLQERIAEVKGQIEKNDFPPERRERFEKFFHDLDSIRELRNHIAHGHLLIRLVKNTMNPVVTLSLPKNLDVPYAPETQHLAFDDLKKALAGLTELIEEFNQLTKSVGDDRKGLV